MYLKEYFEARNYIDEEKKEELIHDWKALKLRQRVEFKHGVFYVYTKEGISCYDHRVFKAKIKWHKEGCQPSPTLKPQDGDRKGSKKPTKSSRRKSTV